MWRCAWICVLISLVVPQGLHGDVIHSRWIGHDADAWSSPDNWDPPMVPDNLSWRQFIVTIETSERTRIRMRQSRTINQLSCSGSIDFEKPIDYVRLTLLEEKGLTNHGDLSFSGETVEWNLTGNITNTSEGFIIFSDDMDMTGVVNNQGTLLLAPECVISIEGGTLVNSGTVTMFGALLSTPDGMTNSGLITGTGLLRSEGLFANDGTTEALGGSLLIYGNILESTGTLRNTPNASLHVLTASGLVVRGRTEVHSGGGITFSQDLLCEPNSVTHLYGGTLAAKTLTVAADAVFTGFGTITGDVLIDADGTADIAGPTQLVGDLRIVPEATLTIRDGQLLVTGKTQCDGDLDDTRGTFTPQKGLSGECLNER